MKVLIDTNIIIDYVSKREPFVQSAATIFQMISDSKLDGCVAAHSIPNIVYILRKSMPETNLRLFLLGLCNLLNVISIDDKKLVTALHNLCFKDFEDCLQVECAKSYDVDYIITRNTKDFIHSEVKAIEPTEFIKLFCR